MSCFKAIFPCCFDPVAKKTTQAVWEEEQMCEMGRNTPSTFISRSEDGTVSHQPGRVGFTESVLSERHFSPLLCSTKLVDEEKIKAKSELDVQASFHTGGTLSESFWKDIKRWDAKTTACGTRKSLIRRHSVASCDAKRISTTLNGTNEFNWTNVIPAYPHSFDMTQLDSTISLERCTVPSVEDVRQMVAIQEVEHEQSDETPNISDDEGCVYDVALLEASFSPMQATFTVGSMPSIAENNATIARKHSIDSNLCAAGTHYTSMASSRSRFTVAPVDEHLGSLQFRPDGSVQFKSP